jgi:hypothetical protein
MRRLLIIGALCSLATAAIAQTPRTSLTGFVIDGAHAGKAIGIVVTPNPQIWSSDEVVPDPKLKWKSWIPIVVWRERRIAGDYRTCPVMTLQLEFVPGQLAQDLQPQVFVIPASLVREFDHFDFEERPWYSLRYADGVIGPGTAAVSPPGALSGWFTINCSDDPRVVRHAAMFKE